MPNSNIKQEAIKLVENLPEDATWDDLMHHIKVLQAIDVGFEDSEAGLATDVKEVPARFGLPN